MYNLELAEIALTLKFFQFQTKINNMYMSLIGKKMFFYHIQNILKQKFHGHSKYLKPL